jgi:hypothetical protein
MRLEPLALCLLLAGCPSPPKDPGDSDSGLPFGGHDGDGDGYGEAVDCDDGDPAVHPGGDEVCNGIDDDCDGFVDDADASLVDGEAWWPDADGDGFGAEGAEALACEPPDEGVDQGGDCDDADPDISPDERESCNGVDDDCDGAVDEAGAIGSELYYPDADGDGFGDAAGVVSSCERPADHVDDDSDCDDDDAAVHPEAQETQAGVDDDCDGTIDELHPDDAWARIEGEAAGDRAGRALAGAGDQDGDGLVDFFVGARGHDAAGADGGAVYLVTGDDPGQRSLGYAAAKLYGPAGSYAGHALDAGRDLDGDGLEDLLVGGPYDDRAATDAGVAWIAYGPFEDGSLEDAVSLSGSYDRDLAGWSVALLADGALVVGAPYGKDGASYPGVAYLLRSPPSADLVLDDVALRLLGEGDEHGAGVRVAAGGDLDGDGLEDLLVGAHTAPFGGSDAGAAYVCLASSLASVEGSLSLSQADGRHHGESRGDMAGYVLAGGDDLDGDGLDDVLIGAPYEDEGGTEAGAVYLIAGPATGFDSLAVAPTKILGARVGDSLGNGLCVAPDMDGDGRAELVVGAPVYSEDYDAGLVGLWSGAPEGTVVVDQAPWLLQGREVGDYLGFALHSPGDMDGDGLGDLLVGVPLDDTVGSEAGKVLVFF